MGFLVVGWGSLKKGLAYGGGFQAAAYMVGGMDWACINAKYAQVFWAEIFAKPANDEACRVCAAGTHAGLGW